jgi:alanine dehydrogenase
MPEVLLLSATDVERLLNPLLLITAVEAAFRARGRRESQPGGVLGIELPGGGFHIKAAALAEAEGVFAVKLNGNFPRNPSTNGLPTIQGLVIVADIATGAPLAVLESGSLTRLRTAAASAVAIEHLARRDADTLTLVGCGVQGFDQARFALAVRALREITLVDTRIDAAEALARRLRDELGASVRVDAALAAACARSAIIITCTVSTRPFLLESMVAAGTLVVAAGADNPHKHELDAALLAHSRVVTDLTAQCATIGDLHHALDAGAMTVDAVHAELGQVVAGVRPGRTSPADRIVFDSTGIPIQDAAAAGLLIARARETGAGARFAFRA